MEPAGIITLVVIIVGLGVMAIGLFSTSKNTSEQEETSDITSEIAQEENMLLFHKESARRLKSIDRTLKFFLWLTILCLIASFIYWLATPTPSPYY